MGCAGVVGNCCDTGGCGGYGFGDGGSDDQYDNMMMMTMSLFELFFT